MTVVPVETETGEIVGRSLDECEQVIAAGLATFMQVGQALAEIRDARLYLASHPDFDAYCIDRWGFDRKRASEFIIAAAVSEISDTPLANEAQASALAPLKDEPEQMRDALAQATAEAEAEGAKLTAQRIKDAVASVMGEATDREAVGVESEDVPSSPTFDPGEAALGDDAEKPSLPHTSPGSTTTDTLYEEPPAPASDPVADTVATVGRFVAILAGMDEPSAQAVYEQGIWEFALGFIADHPDELDLSDVAVAALRTRSIDFPRGMQ